jgi:DnaJ-class molecular chaperone
MYSEERRAIYDQHGYDALKNGYTIDGRVVGYSFEGDPEFIFESFFGSSNPYIQIYSKGKI